MGLNFLFIIFLLRSEEYCIIPGVNHMRGMQYQIVLAITLIMHFLRTEFFFYSRRFITIIINRQNRKKDKKDKIYKYTQNIL